MKYLKIKKMNSTGFTHVELVVIIVVVVLVIGVGSYVFQTHSDSNYKTNVKQSYSAQSAQMTLVFKSFNRPVFASNDTSVSSDTADLTYVNAAIATATADTNALSKKNDIVVIPIVDRIGSASSISREHKAVTDYINDSRNFLADYQTLSTYTQQTENVLTNNLEPVFTSLGNISSDTTLSQLSSDSQTASTSLATLITDMKKIQPPVDLKQFNAEYISALSAMNTDFESIVTGISSQNSQQITSAGLQLQKDATTLENVSNTDVAGLLHSNNSIIQKQITKLEGEDPVAN